MKLKSRLKVILAERDMSQKELINLLSEPVALSTMSKIVNGTVPKLETAFDIAGALNVHIEDIWCVENKLNVDRQDLA